MARRHRRRRGKKGKKGLTARAVRQLIRKFGPPVNTHQKYDTHDVYDSGTYTTNYWVIEAVPDYSAEATKLLHQGEGITNFRYRTTKLHFDIRFTMEWTNSATMNMVGYVYRILVVNNKIGFVYTPTYATGGAGNPSTAFLDTDDVQGKAVVAGKNPEFTNTGIQILYDRTVHLDPGGLNNKVIKIRIPSKHLNKLSAIEHTSQTGSPATYSTGANTFQIYFVTNKPNVNGTSNYPNANVRVFTTVDFQSC